MKVRNESLEGGCAYSTPNDVVPKARLGARGFEEMNT